MFVIGSLALMGFPFLTGFYSKDVILELAYAKYTISSHFAHWLGTLSAFFTAFYSFRLLYLTFLSDPNGYKNILSHAHDAPIRMAFPLVVLAFGSIFVGYLTRDMIIGVGTQFWGSSLFTLPANMNLLEAEFIPHSIKLVPVCFSLFGAFSAYVLYMLSSKELYQYKFSSLGRKVYTFLNRKWFFDKVYHEFVSQNMLSFGYHTSYKAIDRGIIEILGPYGISNTVSEQSRRITATQTGYLYHYAFIMLVGVTVLITIIGLRDVLSENIDLRLMPHFLVSLGILHYTRKTNF
jgi:NADH-ubiquinone oxidoreductase chain 5